MSRWYVPTKVIRYDAMPDWVVKDPKGYPTRTPRLLTIRQQVELGLTHCDEVPEQPTHCCFVPNNDNYIMTLRGANPCQDPPEPDCCDIGDFG